MLLQIKSLFPFIVMPRFWFIHNTVPEIHCPLCTTWAIYKRIISYENETIITVTGVAVLAIETVYFCAIRKWKKGLHINRFGFYKLTYYIETSIIMYNKHIQCLHTIWLNDWYGTCVCLLLSFLLPFGRWWICLFITRENNNNF